MININRVIIAGRITKDPELKKTGSDLSVCSFTLAVNRPYKAEGNDSADFIQCVAWRQSADYLCSYGHKGDLVSVEGKIQTRSYQNDQGRKVYVTEVVADHLQLISREPVKEMPSDNRSNSIDDSFGSLEQFYPPENDHNTDIDISADDLPFY